MRRLRQVLPIVFLLVLASIPRLIFLNTYPDGFNIDELAYVVNAKPVYYSHTDISHQWNLLSFTTLPAEQPNGELPAILMAPFLGPGDFSFF